MLYLYFTKAKTIETCGPDLPVFIFNLLQRICTRYGQQQPKKDRFRPGRNPAIAPAERGPAYPRFG